MNLSLFGFAPFAAGLGLLAGALYLLQRLRVRHREARVPTLLFWKEAVEETRARVLVRRFRHPWAYALALAAASLLWFAGAGPELDGDPELEHLLVLDGSAAMLRGERFADAARAVEERARALPRKRTRVVLASGRLLTILAPGEDFALLRRRIESLAPEAAPSTLAAAVEAAAAFLPPGRRLLAEIHGDGALDEEWGGTLPEGVRVRRVSPPPDARALVAGITALGVSESASGRWDAVDLYLRVEGGQTPPQVELDGVPIAMEARSSGAGTEYFLHEVAARGQRWSARLGGVAASDAELSAVRALPERARLRVGLSPRALLIAPALGIALSADSGVELADQAAEVVLRLAGEDYGAGLPALELVESDPGQAAFTVRGPSRSGAPDEVLDLFDRLGLSEVDAAGLAAVAQREISLRFIEDGGGRRLEVWATLFGAEFDFVQARAFPLFLAAAVRWLAAAPELRSELAAGAWLPAEDAPLRAADGAQLDGAGAPFHLPRAGEWIDAHGRPVTAALLDPALRADAAGSFREDAGPRARSAEVLAWIAVIALALLAVEWILFRRGRIP